MDSFTCLSNAALYSLKKAHHILCMFRYRSGVIKSTEIKLRLQKCRIDLEIAKLKVAEFKSVGLSSTNDFLFLLYKVVNEDIARPAIFFLAGTPKEDVAAIQQLARENGLVITTPPGTEDVYHSWWTSSDALLPQNDHAYDRYFDPTVGNAPPQPNIHGNAPPQPNIHGNAPPQPKIHGNAPPQPNIHGNAPPQPNIHGNAPPQPNIHGNAPLQPNIHANAPPQSNIHANAPPQPNIHANAPPQPNMDTNYPPQPNI